MEGLRVGEDLRDRLRVCNWLTRFGNGLGVVSFARWFFPDARGLVERMQRFAGVLRNQRLGRFFRALNQRHRPSDSQVSFWGK